MKKADVINYFGSQVRTAKAFNINKQAVNQWPDPIPIGRAYQAEVITNGALKVDLSLYENN